MTGKRLLAAFLGASLLLSGCGPAGGSQGAFDESSEENGKLKVAVTLFPYYDFVRQIAGDQVDLQMVIPAGMDSHSFEPTPADIKDFQDTLKAGFIKMFVFNSQEANSTTDQITGAAKDANVPIVELAEQMPKQYTNLLDWMSALVDQFAAAVK